MPLRPPSSYVGVGVRSVRPRAGDLTGLRPAAVAAVAAASGRLTRMFGFGGQVLPGRIALALQPDCLAGLAAGRRVALVSGTNGKTTTTALLTAALARLGPVASNSSGANMPDGIAAVLLANPARLVAAEVDEQYLPAMTAQLDPAVLVLLNLSRDQLDRVGETRRTARRWRDAVARSTTTVIANCDDPLIAWAAREHGRVVWVAAGAGWGADRRVCPDCAHALRIDRSSGAWGCTQCGAARPDPSWAVVPVGSEGASGLRGPDGVVRLLRPALPGGVNRGNAALAIAAADRFGVPIDTAVDASCHVDQVAGRYAIARTPRHRLWLLLAKNPSGWCAILDMLRGRRQPVVIAVNAAEADGRDTSWLYDVPFGSLAGCQVIATGARAGDLGVRLSYAGVAHTTVVGDALAALAQLAPGPVTVVGDYTSFRDACRALRRSGTVHAA